MPVTAVGVVPEKELTGKLSAATLYAAMKSSQYCATATATSTAIATATATSLKSHSGGANEKIITCCPHPIISTAFLLSNILL